MEDNSVSQDELDRLYENLGRLIDQKKFPELEETLRGLDIQDTPTDIVIGYLTNILLVPNDQMPYVQEFRDNAIANLKMRKGYQPIWTAGLEEYSLGAAEGNDQLMTFARLGLINRAPTDIRDN